MSIAINIKRIRENLRLTQADFGKIAGVTDKAVSAWENGLSEPRMGAIQRIADHCGLKKSDIIENDFDVQTIAAHHDGDEWTEEELAEIERFKAWVKSQRRE